MPNSSASILVLLFFAIVVLLLLTRKRRKTSKALIDSLETELVSSLALQRTLLDLSNGYLMHKDWSNVLNSQGHLYLSLSRVPQKIRERHRLSKDIAEFISNYSDPAIREGRNEKFKEIELRACDSLFSDIDGKSLDNQQRNAIVTDEYSNLVIAGAGSGKTLMVVGKIKYLIERWDVKPEEILVTSFTRKSVNELAIRLEKAGIQGVSCETFHQIGLSQLGKVGVANETELRICVVRYLKGEILNHPDEISALVEFLGYFKYLAEDYSSYGIEGKRLEHLKSLDLTTIKGRLDTLHGERVKSLEELMIANYLYLHGVSYEYEKNYSGEYETQGRAYQPDFYLTDYNIWLEHFGIDENGRCPWMGTSIEEQIYIEGIEWKRKVHRENGTTLIESYSYWNKDHDLLNRLRITLEGYGVRFIEEGIDHRSIFQHLCADERQIDAVVSLVVTFLSLAKASCITIEEAAELGREAFRGNGFMWHRFERFITITEPIMRFYQQTLASKGQVDFNDMICGATNKITTQGISRQFRYIIVDEYQDISKSRFRLLKAIRDSCGAKLICVGDDWQSIYRFAGSDVSLFTDFDAHFGQHETLKLEHTYRNSQELVDIAKGFIERNPAQVHKEMTSSNHSNMPVIICYENDMAKGLERCLSNVVVNSKGKEEKVLVLGRHNFDIETAYPGFRGRERYSNGAISLRRDTRNGDVRIAYKDLSNVVFMSVHRSKGLEADQVVVLNLNNDTYGFPNRTEDDPIIRILLGEDDAFDLSEERRLFYVAITRAKKCVYLVSGAAGMGGGPSPFVEELQDGSSPHIGIIPYEEEDPWHPVLCPRCGSGRLVVRNNQNSEKSFLGCTNWPYCENNYAQLEILNDRLKCPSCGGWMVRRRRSSDNSPFFGCSNWPLCCASIDATENYRPISGTSRPGSYSYSFINLREQSRGVPAKQDNAQNAKKCPKCGAPLIERKNSKDGSIFYGCVRFPECRYTRDR